MNTDPTGMCLGAYCNLRCKQPNTSNNAARPNSKPRDVTNEINFALALTVVAAREVRDFVDNSPPLIRPAGEAIRYITFYDLVKAEAAWDIKVPASWEKTIGTPFPSSALVLYDGRLITPEGLGNYTYGYLGEAFGFSQQLLSHASYAVAGAPNEGALLHNEHIDRSYVILGYQDSSSKY